MNNVFIKIATDNKKCLVKKGSQYEVHFGWLEMEGGLYTCIMTVCLYKPSYEKVCEIVDEYNRTHGTGYIVTEEDYNR